MMSPIDPWAVLLAGGEGTRLKPLPRRIFGDMRPKQFRALAGAETLIDATRRRADMVVRPDRQLVVVTRAHAWYYTSLEDELLPDRLVVQPANRGTAPGILYPLIRAEVLDDTSFAASVAGAMEVVQALPGHVVLGIQPEWPETEYGWIEPAGRPVPLAGGPAFAIRQFWEKPSAAVARTLYARGCLWNSFVMVGWVSAFRAMMADAVPQLVAAFQPVNSALGTPREGSLVSRVYARMPDTNFSARVLERSARRLPAVRVENVGWSDLGSPARVLASLRRSGRRPAWFGDVEVASTA